MRLAVTPRRGPDSLWTAVRQYGSSPAFERLAVAILAAATLLWAAFLIVRVSRSPFGGADFESYHSAALALRDGGRLYERALAWRDAGYAVAAPGEPPTAGMPYVYPPLLAAALLPFTVLPAPQAALLWRLLTLGCVLASAFLLVRLLLPAARGPRRALATLGLTLAFLYFQPTRAILFTAQADCLVLLLLTLCLASAVKGRETRAALWLALAAAVKPTVAFLFLYFLLKGRRRAAAVGAAAGAAVLGGGLLLLGPGAIGDYLSLLRYWSSPAFAVSPVNQSLYGMALRLTVPNPYTVPLVAAPLLAEAVRYAVSGGGAAALVLLLRPARGRTSPGDPVLAALEFGAVVVAMLLVGPLSQDNHYVQLLLPLTAIAAACLTAPGERRARAVLGGGLAIGYGYLALPRLSLLAGAFNTYFDGPVGAPLLWLTGAHLYGLCFVAGLTGLTLWWYRRRRPAAVPHVP